MNCPYCKGPMVEEEMDYVVELDDGQEIRIEGVPTWFCEHCDYTMVEDDVIEAVEDMLEHLDEVGADAADEEE